MLECNFKSFQENNLKCSDRGREKAIFVDTCNDLYNIFLKDLKFPDRLIKFRLFGIGNQNLT